MGKHSLSTQLELQQITSLLYNAEDSVVDLLRESVNQNIKANVLFKDATGLDIYSEILKIKKNILDLPIELQEYQKTFISRFNEMEKMIKEFS
jgi:hypothetical protein